MTNTSRPEILSFSNEFNGVVHVKDIHYKDSMRKILFRNVPKDMITPLGSLIDRPYLTAPVNSYGAYIEVDTNTYSLIAVHTALAISLLGRKPNPASWLFHTFHAFGAIHNATAEAYIEREDSVFRVFLAFASELEVKEKILTYAKSLRMTRLRGRQ